MRRLTFVVIWAIFMAGSLMRAQQGTRAAPTPASYLSVKSVTYDPSAKVVRMLLNNSGSKRITACGLLVVDRQITEELFYAIGLETRLMSPRPAGLGGIAAGEAAEFLVPDDGTRVPSVEMNAVVFEDRTAVGDETEIESIFRDRLAYASEWQRWTAEIQQSKLQDLDSETFRAVKESLVARLKQASNERALPEQSSAAVRARSALVSLFSQLTAENRIAFIGQLQDRSTILLEHSRRRKEPTQ